MTKKATKSKSIRDDRTRKELLDDLAAVHDLADKRAKEIETYIYQCTDLRQKHHDEVRRRAAQDLSQMKELIRKYEERETVLLKTIDTLQRVIANDL
jgi:hypothetical protein